LFLIFVVSLAEDCQNSNYMLLPTALSFVKTVQLKIPLFPSGRNSFFIALVAFSLSFFSLFNSIPVFSQSTYILDKTTHFEIIGVKEGLSSDGTNCIHQDQFGFIWIGTQQGLSLYDGDKFKVFQADLKKSQSIFNGFIQNIVEEPDGTLWFSTHIGISKFNRANHTFSNYIPDTVNLHSVRNQIQTVLMDGNYLWVEAVNDLYRFEKESGTFISFGDSLKGIYGGISNYIFLDKMGVLWVGSTAPDKTFALNKFNEESQKFIRFLNDPADVESFNNKQISSIIEDDNGTIWVATIGGGLLKILEKESGKFKNYLHSSDDPNSLLNNELFTLFKDSKGNIWTGGTGGFSALNTRNGQFTNYKIPPLSDDHSSENIITNINEDEKGNLWLITNDGLFKFNPSTKLIVHYLNNKENQYSLSGDKIQQIMHDASGQVWVSTRNNGISKLNLFSNLFKTGIIKDYDKNPVSSNKIMRLFEDSQSNFWIATAYGGIIKTALNNTNMFNDFEHFLFDSENKNSIGSNSIFEVYEDKDQILWFGADNGLNSYNPNDHSFKRYQNNPNDTNSISANDVEAIFEDSHGTFWIGTRNGLNILDKKSGKFIRFLQDDTDDTNIASKEILTIFEDSYGELWIGGSFLERLNRTDSSFVHYFPNNQIKSDIYRTAIWDIEEDDSANLWLVSDRGGLYKMNRENFTFSSITIDDGLPSNFLSAIEIEKDNIWLSSMDGLSRINMKNQEIKNFNVADGLVSKEFYTRSSYKDSSGWLYFGGREGFNVFHPDSIIDNTFIPPVYITALRVTGHEKFFDEPLHEMENIELDYNENDFSFDFVALNYINPQKNQYAYMLEGYDEEWKYVGNERTATYTNMSPGNYTFKVKGSNNDGYWNEQEASLAVTIFSPFWTTWWAYLIYGITFFGLILLVRRNEIKRINLRQELELEQAHAVQLAELDIEKNKFFSNISHEFRTPLTLILGPLDRYITKLKNEDDIQELSLVRRNARRLQSLINQLLSLSKLESGKMKLKARPENIVKLTCLFVDSFQSMAQDRCIKLEFESDTEEQIVCIDTLKYEKVVNNLLSNAFKFTESGGKIKVSVLANYTPIDPSMKEEKPPSDILVKFSDTGIGIRKEKLAHVFDRFYQVDDQQMKNTLGTGIGLALTKELVELHHGTITVSSEAGMGTTFMIYLPKGEDHLTEDELFKSTTNVDKSDDELIGSDYLFLQDVVTNFEMEAKAFDSKNPLILIVEDNDDMRSYIKSYLTDSYNIIEATNGNQGVEMAIEKLPDLIVSDLMMPFLDGNEMTELLKNDERTSHIPIILLTAKASMETKLEGLETGADDFLTKPFDANELLVRIKNLVEQRKKLRELLAEHIGDVSQTRIIKESAGKAMNKMDEQFLEKAVAVVNEHISEPEFSTELFATEMAMSRVQLHRKLKSLTDNSTGDFIRNLRLKKAAELLRDSGLNVTQVSYEVGISSLSYFSKVFKEKYSVNPSDYS
jgi:signal transduction histidine kinase/ligand-binding sensor domain-containing protein/DNA-binding response OmpR family regulator